MGNLQIKRRTGPATIPAQHTTLSVSWLGTRFRALAIHRGQVASTWESPQPVEGTEGFGDLIRRAALETGYHGTTVSLVMTHPRLVYQLVEVPPAKGPALAKVLERQAQQQSRSLFPAEAAWSAQPAVSGKGPSRYLYNLFPKPLLDQLTAGCEKADLFLTAVLPPTAVLQSQLLELSAKENAVVMIAAETGDSTTVLVGCNDGRMLLARTLEGSWNEGLPRMAVDLKRTVLFVNQQFGVEVETIFLFGRGAAEQVSAVQAQSDVPVQLSPVPYTDDYWATEPLRSSAGQGQNLISLRQQMAPRRQILFRVAAMLTTVLVLISVGAAVYLYGMQAREREVLAQLRKEADGLRTRHQELQALHNDLAGRQALVRVVADGRAPAVGGWILGYLSEAVPRELIITNLTVRREDSLWRVRLSGVPQVETTKAATNAVAKTLADAVATLTNRLATGPFHMRFLDAAPAEKTASAPTGAGTPPMALASWLSRLGNAPAGRGASESSFALEGVVQP
ncbi:MAG TPA: hypothetical protein PKM73_20855 [Verrucomicrobiota bacterium]|nr:hypothetical protein [Verrucomicrobiota bacterium]HNU53238.1 hypothetical protein [Verrucomicrobiota bacterium]